MLYSTEVEKMDKDQDQKHGQKNDDQKNPVKKDHK